MAAVSASRRLLVAEEEAGLQGATQAHATSEACTSSSHPIEASADLSLARLLARTTAPPRATTAAEASGSPSFTMSLPCAAAVAKAGPSMTTMIPTATMTRRRTTATTTSVRLAAAAGTPTTTTERGSSWFKKKMPCQAKTAFLPRDFAPAHGQLCHSQGTLPSPPLPVQLLRPPPQQRPLRPPLSTSPSPPAPSLPLERLEPHLPSLPSPARWLRSERTSQDGTSSHLWPAPHAALIGIKTPQLLHKPPLPSLSQLSRLPPPPPSSPSPSPSHHVISDLSSCRPRSARPARKRSSGRLATPRFASPLTLTSMYHSHSTSIHTLLLLFAA